MLTRRLLVPSAHLRIIPTRPPCTLQLNRPRTTQRFFSRAPPLQEKQQKSEASDGGSQGNAEKGGNSTARKTSRRRKDSSTTVTKPKKKTKTKAAPRKEERYVGSKGKKTTDSSAERGKKPISMGLKEAMLQNVAHGSFRNRDKSGKKLQVLSINAEELDFSPVDVAVPPIPMLSYGLDRVLFNPGVYRLQDPRSRVYNFDPYLERIMKVNEFDFTALEEYKTSSQDLDLLAMTKRLGTKFTGSTSSMSGILQHFHYLLSHSRPLNHDMLSRAFPKPSEKPSKITMGPSAAFLRWKDGIYAIDADKSYDTPNIMSWLGNSLEKLLTSEKSEFERYRRSNPEKAPAELGGRCFHYSTQGNFLMRSQLDAVDPRLPGTGVFDLKTRAVVSIRMDYQEYEKGSGYQIRYDRGEWESFEREFYDMSRATMLKYSLQVRMGRMDGIFIAFHNIERIFGFQYLSLSDMDLVLHGQSDTCLGDQEFRLSLHLLDQVLQKATAQFPNQTLRFHFWTKSDRSPFMYIFAEPVSDEQADEIQATNKALNDQFAREIVGLSRPGSDESALQAEWQDIQHRVDEEVKGDQATALKPDVDEEGSVEPANEPEESQVNEEEQEDIEESENSEEESEATENSEKSEGAQDAEEELEETVDEAETVAADVKAPKKRTKTTSKRSEKKSASQGSSGPLAGWTLAIRNKVNGGYVKRPENLTPDDDWSVEYHINQLPADSVWSLYNNTKEEREKLIGEQKLEDRTGLEFYRKIIHKYSKQGRQWREKQDAIDKAMGQRIYEPLGPGSPGYEHGKN